MAIYPQRRRRSGVSCDCEIDLGPQSPYKQLWATGQPALAPNFLAQCIHLIGKLTHLSRESCNGLDDLLQ